MSKKDVVMTIRVPKEIYQDIELLSETLGISKSEVWRRMYWTVKILFDPKLKMSDALISNRYTKLRNKPLAEVLKPLPELLTILLSE